MKLLWFSNPEELGREAAAWIARFVREGACRTMVLPTGRTPRPLYRDLARRVWAREVSFRRLRTFGLDELCGLAPSHPLSFAGMLRRDLLDLADQPPDAHTFLDGSHHDPDATCAAFERALREAGGVDLTILGLGLNGHIGMNEPGSCWGSRTRRVRLTRDTLAALEDAQASARAGFTGEGMTLGLGTILESRTILLLVTGDEKRVILRRLLEEPAGIHLPASCLHGHPGVTAMVDAAAHPVSQVSQPSGEAADSDGIARIRDHASK